MLPSFDIEEDVVGIGVGNVVDILVGVIGVGVAGVDNVSLIEFTVFIVIILLRLCCSSISSNILIRSSIKMVYH
jgi:hypothetical protein